MTDGSTSGAATTGAAIATTTRRRLASAQATTNATTATTDSTMTIGFHVGETSSQSASDYVKFAPGASLGDGESLQIRPYANACVWSFQNGNGNWDTTENWSHVKVMKSVAYMHKYTNMPDSGNYAQWFSGKANKFEGWMKVEAGQEGEWIFKMGYDDNKMLVIDGDVLIREVENWETVFTAKKTLARGWHRWEVRVQDGAGGWGPNGVNNCNTLSYIAPGEQEKQFNETNLKLAATLGDISVLERTGIYRELDVGEGAEVVSAGTEPMAIFGTLKGKGALSGAFAFAGDASEWEVEGMGARSILTSCAVFNDATPATFKDLVRVKALFDARPLVPTYVLANAPAGLTSDDLANVATTVKDVDGNDYSDAFSVRVKAGKIVLANARPSGMTIYIR